MAYPVPKPPFAWTCPFCGHDATIQTSDFHSESTIYTTTKHGIIKASMYFVRCPNLKCKEFAFHVNLLQALEKKTIPINKWRLIPPSEAKVFPDYVPKPIRDDYMEACLIRDLSPKASATLARRSIQGMIRDFWKVKKSNLKQEIEAIKDKVDLTTWGAIDAVREVGNIGAHMEQDINLIIEVEPNEANLLINLIEILMKDWYITRHEREESLKSIKKLGETKKAQKKKNKDSLKGIVLPSKE